MPGQGLVTGSTLLLAVYVAAVVLAIGVIPHQRWRALLYSLPLPMTMVLLGTGEHVDGHHVLGVLMLMAFFVLAASVADRGRQLLAVPVALIAYVVGSTALSSVGTPPVWVAAPLGLVVWLVVEFRTGIGRVHSAAGIQRITVTRAAIVLITAVIGVSLGGVIGAYAVTFPYAGVLVALDNRRQLAAFTLNVLHAGLPGLLAYVVMIHLVQDSLGDPWRLLAGLLAWVLASVGVLLLVRMRRRLALRRIAAAIGIDPGHRGIGGLQDDRQRVQALGAGSRMLHRARSVAIVTGFPIPSVQPMRAETDGPAGSVALAMRLVERGCDVHLVTDVLSAPVVEGAARAVDLRVPMHALAHEDEVDTWSRQHAMDAVIFIERPGPSGDGTYRSMSAREITGMVPLERLRGRLGTIGVGDGGNEVGMGSVTAATAAHVANGETIACVVSTDVLVVAGTSNWGALALAAAVSLDDPVGSGMVSLSTTVQRAALAGCIAAGGIDGVRGEAVPTVDGLDEDAYESVVRSIQSAAAWPRRA